MSNCLVFGMMLPVRRLLYRVQYLRFFVLGSLS
jgi:hypothetical protein